MHNPKVHILFVLHEMGTLDHAVALKEQVIEAGGKVSHTLLSNQKIPKWARVFFPKKHFVKEATVKRDSGKFDAYWFSEPYEEFRSAFWSDLSAQKFSIYSGYGVPLTNWVKGNYELDFFSKCNLILASSPHAAKMYNVSSNGLNKSVWSGDPLLFKIKNQQTAHKSNKTILWASHWTNEWVDGSRGFSRWDQTVEPLLSFFQQNLDMKLIIRGHPHLDIENAATIGSSKLESFKKLRDLPNVKVSDQSMTHDIEQADAMISDGVSILAYYGITGKPVGFVSEGTWVQPFNTEGFDIAQACESLANETEIYHWLLCQQAYGPLKNNSNNSLLSKVIAQKFPLKPNSPGSQLYEIILSEKKSG